MSGGVFRYSALVLLSIAVVVFSPERVQGTTYYTSVGLGASHRDAHDGQVHFNNGILSPVLEAGLRTRSGDLVGFYVRFLIDSYNTTNISSYYICGKWSYYYLLDLLYVGASGGLHIESRYDNSEAEQNSTVRSEDAHALFNAAIHTGLNLELIGGYHLVLDCFAAQSLGSNMPWSINGTIGVMTYF